MNILNLKVKYIKFYLNHFLKHWKKTMFIGLRILAFPCNQFNGQEPGNSDDICSFADRQKV